MLSEIAFCPKKPQLLAVQDSSKNADTALFFYAGHAVQGDSRNYLLPTDAVLCGEVDFSRKGVGLNYVMEVLEKSNSKVNLVMLDACRTNPFGDFRGSGHRGFFNRGGNQGGLAAISTTLPGTVIVYAAAPGKGASDNPAGRNGLFTEGLKHAFNTNKNLSLDGVLDTASRWVTNKSKNRQIPYVNGPTPLQKDFFFAGSKEQLVSQQRLPLPQDKPKLKAEEKNDELPPVVMTYILKHWSPELLTAAAFLDKKQFQKALPFLLQAASRGEAIAQFMLAGMYMGGLGVNRDPAKANKLINQVYK
ncbi:hypothetical protein TI05_17595, partial [Achromatium sp. WMS3]